MVQIIPSKTSHYFKQCHDNPIQWHIYVFLDHDELVVMVTEGDDINFRCGHVVWATHVIDDIAMTAARGQETAGEWYQFLQILGIFSIEGSLQGAVSI